MIDDDDDDDDEIFFYLDLFDQCVDWINGELKYHLLLYMVDLDQEELVLNH